MWFLLRIFCALACCVALFARAGKEAAAAGPSPVGLWQTVDDHTHKPRGVVRIYEENGVFFGRIETSFDPEERVARCEKCTGRQKDAPIVGLVIMRGIVKRGEEYAGGEILDPETGSTYSCRFTLSGEGEKLFLRGYLGVSLFGRTQTWFRTNAQIADADAGTLPVTKAPSTASLAKGRTP